MKSISAWMLGGVMLAGVIGMLIVGCESTETTGSAITVTLSASTITGKGAVTLTAASGGGGTNTTAGLALPLVWTVSDAALGHIKSSAGVTAVYESSGKVGNNAITVYDQGDSEGVAVVVQQ
jgi:hypothetical protein